MTVPAPSDSLVSIPVDGVELDGNLVVPEGATGLVVFAHGSGSSRHSPRNNYVAGVLRERGLGTLLIDLPAGAEDRDVRFDVGRRIRDEKTTGQTKKHPDEAFWDRRFGWQLAE